MSNGTNGNARRYFWPTIAGVAVMLSAVTGTLAISARGTARVASENASAIVRLREVDAHRGAEVEGFRRDITDLRLDVKEILRRLPQ